MSKEELQAIKNGYISLFHHENPTAKHLVKWLYSTHDRLVKDAQKSNDPNEAFGLLKQASGIIKVLEHIKTQTGKDLHRE